MPTDCLPNDPDLQKLRDHAKALRDLVRAGDGGSIALVCEHHPRFAELDLNPVLALPGEMPSIALDARVRLSAPADKAASPENAAPAAAPAGVSAP